MKLYRSLIQGPLLAVRLGIGSVIIINGGMVWYASPFFTTDASVVREYGIVLGASVYNGTLSDVLEDRVLTAKKRYDNGKFKRFYVTGDDRDPTYQEVTSVVAYLTGLGVPLEDINLDRDGLDTYDSMRRAKQFDNVKDAYIFTQKFHLARSIYIARRLGIDARGVPSDGQHYEKIIWFTVREAGARIKAFVEVELLTPSNQKDAF